MKWQAYLRSDRTLAVLAVVFVGDVLLLQWIFGTARSESEIVYWTIIWIATILVVGMTVVALGHLLSEDTTLLGGFLAVLALLHAPLFLGMRFGLVNLPTMQTFDVVSRAIVYPLLGVVALVLLIYRVLSSEDRSIPRNSGRR